MSAYSEQDNVRIAGKSRPSRPADPRTISAPARPSLSLCGLGGLRLSPTRREAIGRLTRQPPCRRTGPRGVQHRPIRAWLGLQEQHAGHESLVAFGIPPCSSVANQALAESSRPRWCHPSKQPRRGIDRAMCSGPGEIGATHDPYDGGGHRRTARNDMASDSAPEKQGPPDPDTPR